MFIPLYDKNPLRYVRFQYVTIGIIALNTLLFFVVGPLGHITPASADILFQYALFEEALSNKNLIFDEAVVDGRLRLISYAFLHGDFWHLASNMLFLWVFGDNVEDDLGHFGFLLFYLAAAVLSGWAHTLLTEPSMTPLVGASGAVSGVMAAYVVAHPNVRVWVLALGRIPLPIPALWLIVAWGGWQLVSIVIFPDSAVSYAAHIGGLAAGLAIFPFVRRKPLAP